MNREEEHPLSRIIVTSVIVLGALSACSQKSPPPEANPAPSPAPAPAATAPRAAYVSQDEARKMFVARCASCHGMEGKGDGPGSVALNPKPRNYTDGAWQKTVTDDEISKAIMYGGAAVGKSPIMPAQADLQSKPEAVAALVKVVRSFAPTTP